MGRLMPIVIIFALIVTVFLFAPVLIVVPMSFTTSQSYAFPPPGYWTGQYAKYFSDPTWYLPTINSFTIALGTAILTLALVIPAAYAVVRYRFKGRAFANMFLITPLLVPTIISAIAYYKYLSYPKLVGTHIGVILAHTCLATPVAMLIMAAALKGYDRNLERAAMMSGAGVLRTFFYVTFPVLRPGIVVAGLFAFLNSFDETVVSLFIAGRAASTLPKRMFESIQLDTDPVIAVVSTMLFLLVICMFLLQALLRRRQFHGS
ncbi:MAG: ABC transporter permease [Alphaproteobacteria bacterium]|nr:ABC transporter permease [Alphaproteobacteria bacterium]